MAKRKPGRRRRTNWIVALLVAAVAAFCVLTSCQEKHGLKLGIPEVDIPSLDGLYDVIEEFVGGLDIPEDWNSGGTSSMDNALAVSGPVRGAEVSVHFLDVGQAKSILIRGPEKNVLIDAGENHQGDLVLRYLQEQDVGRLDILIGTHPHSDHIGGMDTVIDGIEVETLILPELPEDLVPTTQTYTDLLMAIIRKGLTITPSEPGAVYDLGGGAALTILAPQAQHADLNDMSVCARLTYGDTAFLFTGDAGAESEAAMLEDGAELWADVLDVGHHGSSTATGKAFLRAVSPQVAVISCGIDNAYGHPDKGVMERLMERDVTALRTDLHGTVVIWSNGESIGIQKENA